MMSLVRHPTLQVLLHHRAIAVLLAMQVSLACAVSANALRMTVDNLAAMQLPSGMDEQSLVLLPMPQDADASAVTRAEDLSAILELPGVDGAIAMQGMPFGIDVTGTVTRDEEGNGGVAASIYGATRGALQTLGLQLDAGRDFTLAEYPGAGDGEPRQPAVAIVSDALARRLYGGAAAALGQTMQVDGEVLDVVGVVGHLLRGQPQAGATDDENDYSVLVPAEPKAPLGIYAIHALRGDARWVALGAARRFRADKSIEVPHTLADARQEYFARSSADTRLLAIATTAFLIVTAIGMWGLSMFWARRRVRSLGILRAIGATRNAVVRGLLLENLLVVAVGNAIGLVLAIAANRWLPGHAGFIPLPVSCLGASTAMLWLLGASAAFIPALRAAALPPAAVLRIS